MRWDCAALEDPVRVEVRVGVVFGDESVVELCVQIETSGLLSWSGLTILLARAEAEGL